MAEGTETCSTAVIALTLACWFVVCQDAFAFPTACSACNLIHWASHFALDTDVALIALAESFSRLFVSGAFTIVTTATSTCKVAVLSSNILDAGALRSAILLSVLELILAAAKEHGRLLGEGALCLEAVALAAWCTLFVVAESELEVLVCDKEPWLRQHLQRNVCGIVVAY